MTYCKLQRIWTDNDDVEYSEYEINLRSNRICINSQSYYIAKSEVELAINNIEQFDKSQANEELISFGDFGNEFPPSIRMNIKKNSSFKNLLVVMKCEIDIDDVDGDYDICQMTFLTDFTIFKDFLNELKDVSEFKKKKIEINF